MVSPATSLIPTERIEQSILLIRGQKVMLDRDLAKLYGVQTRELNQAVRRNSERFPEDFMFQLTQEEFDNLMSQFVTSSWGGTRKLPLVFTEQGVAMLSSVLKSKKAIQINIGIMRAFVRLRRVLATNEELAKKIKELESSTDKNFKVVFRAIFRMMKEPPETKRKIGFQPSKEIKRRRRSQHGKE